MSIWTDLTGTDFRLSYVDVAGLRTRTLRAGEGDPVVFLHGTSGHLEAFVRNIPAHAAAGYACHAIDMLGHGYTEGPDHDYRIPRYVDHVLAYLDSQGIDKAHFVGESLGGWVAGRLAADHPERVGRLSLVAPGGTVANPEVMERIRTSTRKAVESDDIGLTRKRLELLMFDPAANVSDELVRVRHDIYHRPEFVKQLPHLLCLQDMVNRTEDLLTTEQLNRIAAPTLVVWGAQNPFGDVPEAHKLAERVPNSRLEIFAECGHWPQHEHAARFNALHLDFLREEQAA
ncbi:MULTISPECIES: alpha/beta fold hydrolase [unclassified Streptomyces]|uniref:alpha/beta fold hydrolase n=1 Tax=unclassified Streptomyces TaxID=2593676 RepID=UPI00278C6F8C|nr:MULTISPECIES: alpha/beta fold hydrolase [unclassified Streptomyces]